MRKLKTGIAIIILSVACLSCWAQTPEEESLKKGAEYVKSGENDKAIAEFDKVIAASPVLAEAYYGRGLAYYKLGKQDAAIADLNKVIEINPASTDAYYNRAMAYYKKGSYAPALADYNKVLEITPDAVDAYYGRGLVYYKMNDIKKAIADYDKVIAIRPELPLAYSARAIAYFSKKDYGRTLADINKAVSLGFRARPLKIAEEKSAVRTSPDAVAQVMPAIDETKMTTSVANRSGKQPVWVAKRRKARIMNLALTVLLIIALVSILILLRKRK